MRYLATIVILMIILVWQPKPTTGAQQVQIFSGNCTIYKKTFVPPSQVRYTGIGKGYAKLVVDRTHKHLNFYFENKLVFSRDEFDSYIDTNQGGEGFTSYNDVDAHSFPAEGKFQINVGQSLYEISNYRAN